MTKEKKFAVILSGCGVYDGSEIHEAVLTLYAISKHHCTYEIFAPDIPQYHVVNHLTGAEMDETRNVLVESARIARGKIHPLRNFNAADFDALVLPGGFGAAKNLSDYAFKGSSLSVREEVTKAIKDMASQNKPIGALCIAPVILAKLFPGAELTIGQDTGTIKHLQELGAKHTNAGHGEIIIDKELRIVTTPCYMLDATIDQIGTGAENVIKAIIDNLLQ